MAGSFIMTEGNPILIKSDDDTRHTTAAGCQGTYNNTVVVNSISALGNAVANANTSTKIVLANGTYTSGMTLNGNTAPVCIEAENKKQTVLKGNIEIRGSHIVMSKFLITGSSAKVNIYGDDCRLTLNTFDNPSKSYFIRALGTAHRFKLDHNTIKNFHHVSGDPLDILIWLHTYADDNTPAGHQIEYNYFENLTSDTINGFATIQTRLRRSATQLVGMGEHPSAYGEDDNGWNYGRDVVKKDNITLKHNYFKNCNDPLSCKTNGMDIAYNTIRDCSGSVMMREGKFNNTHNNYFFGGGKSSGISIYDRNHKVEYNYFENMRRYAMEVHNGGVAHVDNDIYAASLNTEIHHNYVKDTEWAIIFGRKMDNNNNTDIAPSGSFTDNTFVNIIDTPIHLSEEPHMENFTTSPNSEYNTANDPSWDMSGVITDADVTNGIVGSGI